MRVRTTCLRAGLLGLRREEPGVLLARRALGLAGERVPGAKYAAVVLAANSPHLSVLDELGDHLQVVWGALVAFAIVVLLTPAVGGMARRLGVVDIPGGRRINELPVPRLGGIGLFLGMLVPALAFLHVGLQKRVLQLCAV